MRKEFDPEKESFVAFSVSLTAGDTAIFDAVGAMGPWLGSISGLLRRGIVVRTPQQAPLDLELHRDAELVEQVARLAAAMDRKVSMASWSKGQREQAAQVKSLKGTLEAKAHRLVVEEGLGIVAACRKVHCRPSDYYIYRSKLKTQKNG